MEKYYIVSNKHTNGIVRSFWEPFRNGYTIDLTLAGIYSEEQIAKEDIPIVTKHNVHEKNKYPNFAISVWDVDLLGRKMTCILN